MLLEFIGWGWQGEAWGAVVVILRPIANRNMKCHDRVRVSPQGAGVHAVRIGMPEEWIKERGPNPKRM